MTADQLEKAMGYLEHWMDQRALLSASPITYSDWYRSHMKHTKEKLAATVLGVEVENLPDSLRFTAHEP